MLIVHADVGGASGNFTFSIPSRRFAQFATLYDMFVDYTVVIQALQDVSRHNM